MATERSSIRRALVSRDVARAFAVLVGLVVLMYVVRVQAIQVPGYLVVLGFELVQNAVLPDIGNVGYVVLLAGYLYLLAVVVAAAYRVAERSV